MIAALVPAVLGITAGGKIYSTSKKAAGDVMEGALSKKNVYRYVRFLPDFVHVTALTSAAAAKATLATEDGVGIAPFLALPTPTSGRVYFFHSPSDAGHHARFAAEHTWKDPNTGGSYALLGVATDYETAEPGCASLGAEPDAWRLPSFAELSSAARGGLFDPKRNGAFGSVLARADRAWLMIKGVKGMDPCQLMHTAPDYPTTEYAPCWSKVAAVCRAAK